MPKEIRPHAFSSPAVPRSGLSCNLLSPTRAAPSPPVRGEGASLCRSSLGTGAGPPRPWCEAAAPSTLPMASHAVMLKAGPGRCASVGTADFVLASQQCARQPRLAAACSRRVPWSPASGFCCSIPPAGDVGPALVAAEPVLPVPMAVLLRPRLTSRVLLPPLPQSLSFRGYRKDFFL